MLSRTTHSITIIKFFKLYIDILKVITLILATAVPIFLMSAIRFLIDLMKQYKASNGTCKEKSFISLHIIFLL